MPFTAPFRRPRLHEAKIVVDDDGFYRGALNGADPGRPAWVVIVDDDQGSPWGACAWCAEDPSEWWIGALPYPGHQSLPPIMGASEIMFASYMGADLLLVENPQRWCALAGSARWPGPAAAILDWRRPDALRIWLSLLRAVQCETARLARAVESVLGAAPARQRLRVTLAQPVETMLEATPERVIPDPGTILEPYPLCELGEARADANHEEATA